MRLTFGGLAVLGALSCTSSEEFIAPEPTTCAASEARSALRVMSYNIKSGLESSLREVAEEIEVQSPDVVALQEVDRGVDRTGREDQAAWLAARLGYQAVYAAAIERGGGTYGIALLTRLPVAEARRIELRALGAWEPRVALDVTLCHGPDAQLRVVSTHADILAGGANLAQLRRELAASVGTGVLLMGDLNATPDSGGPRDFAQEGLDDLIARREGPTFWPNATRLDYIYADGPWAERLESVHIGTRKASDHFPVAADFVLP